MCSLSKIVKTVTLIAACVLVVTAARAVSPPPDGGYANHNTAEGEDALFNLSDFIFASDNTAVGYHSLFSNSFGVGNTAIGSNALSNATGNSNTATGVDALQNNNTGYWNTANGAFALVANTTGGVNVASGYAALGFNTTGNDNTATGTMALGFSTVGNQNTATGSNSLGFNAIGNDNTATGFGALYGNRTGINNTATGSNAMFHNHNGSNNIALGYQAGKDLSSDYNIAIGNPGIRKEAGTIRIGQARTHTNTYIAGISGVTVAGGVGVIIDTDGHLGTVVSSERFKDAVRPMDKASEVILSLKPITFRYKTALDPKGIPQFGLVAEQVAKVNPDLVARDDQGKPYTVRYEAVNAMLLNEFLKAHRKVAQQSDQIAELQATVAELKSAFKAQAAEIQKVSDQLAADKPAPRSVADNQ